MALNSNTITRMNETTTGTPGTLSSLGLYKNVSASGNPAQGVRGAGLAYVSDVGPQDLVENRLTNLTARGGQYIDNARSRGLQGAAKRGMLNSSIAQGSAERAAIESALPIASQDAQTMADTRMLNQTELNKNLMQDRDIQNEWLLAERQASSSLEAARAMARDEQAARQHDLQMQRERLAFEGEQGGLNRQFDDYMAQQGHRFGLENMQNEYGYDIGRMGYGAELGDRTNYRDYLNQLSLDNNRFANNRYDAFLATELSNMQGLGSFLQELIMNDPSIDPTSLNGVSDFLNRINSGYISNLLSRYGLGG